MGGYDKWVQESMYRAWFRALKVLITMHICYLMTNKAYSILTNTFWGSWWPQETPSLNLSWQIDRVVWVGMMGGYEKACIEHGTMLKMCQ